MDNQDHFKTEQNKAAEEILQAFSRSEDDLEVVSFCPSAVIYAEGDGCNHVYILLDGVVKILVVEHGKEKIISLLEPGEIFGWMTITGVEVQTSSAVAFDKVTVARIGNEALLQRMQQEPKLLFHLINNAARQLRQAYREIYGLSFQYQIGQMAQQLWDLYERFPAEENGRPFINLRLNQQVLGDLLGVARETANKLVHTLKADGVIEMEKQRVWITDPDGLKSWIQV